MAGRGLTIFKTEGLDMSSNLKDLKDPLGSTSTYQRSEFLDKFNEARVLKKIITNNIPEVAISYLKRSLDDFSRAVIYNHTIIISEENYRILDAYPEIFEKHFIKEVNKSDSLQLDLIKINEKSKESTLPNEIDLNIILKYITEKEKLIYIIDSLINKNKVAIKIDESSEDAIKLAYSLIKVLPPMSRLLPFITAPNETSDYKLVIYASQRPHIDFYSKKEKYSDISNDIASAIISRDINSLEKIHNTYDNFINKEKISPVAAIELYDVEKIPNIEKKNKKKVELFEKENKIDGALQVQKQAFELTKSEEDLNKLLDLSYKKNDLKSLFSSLDRLPNEETKLQKIEDFLSVEGVNNDFKNTLIEVILAIFVKSPKKIDILINYKNIYKNLVDNLLRETTFLKDLKNEKMTLELIFYLIIQLKNESKLSKYFGSKEIQKLKQALTDFDIDGELSFLLNNPKQSLLHVYVSQLNEQFYWKHEYDDLIKYILETYVNKLDQIPIEKINQNKPRELLKNMVNENLIYQLSDLLNRYGAKKSKNKLKSFLEKLIYSVVEYNI